MAEMTRSTNTVEIDSVLEIRQILAMARSNFFYTQFGREDAFQERQGNTIKWYTRSGLTAQTAAIADVPAAKKSTISHTAITANLAMYGNDSTLTEALQVTSVLDLAAGIKEEMAYNAGDSIDTVVRDTLLAVGSGITHLFANGKTSASITSADVATVSDFQDIATVMKNAKVPMVKHPGSGRNVYVAIITPKVENALMKDTTFKQMSQFGNQTKYWQGEIGTILDICFVVSTNVTTYTFNSIACEKSLIVGRDAYGVAAMPKGTGGSIPTPSVGFADNQNWTQDKVNSMFRLDITPPLGGPSDPHKVLTTVAWTAYFAHKILQPTFMRTYVTSSVLTSSFS
jgi:N4-gp56 family major capsid protein